MTEQNAPLLADEALTAFAGKLMAWAEQLTADEQTLLLAMVARAALAEPADTQGYVSSSFDSQIAAMMNNNLTFLALQTKVQNVSQLAQLLSNVAQTDHETKLNVARNARA